MAKKKSKLCCVEKIAILLMCCGCIGMFVGVGRFYYLALIDLFLISMLIAWAGLLMYLFQVPGK